jgi:hypothetical protein
MAVVAAEPQRPERPAELRYADPAMDAIAADVWEKNFDASGELVYVPDVIVSDNGPRVRGIDVLRGAVDYQWQHRQRGVSERGGARTAAAG